MSSCSSAVPTIEKGGDLIITAIHPDIIQTQIFTRLDGPTLASTACASSHLQALSHDDRIWRDICNSTWPSTANPLIRSTISTFRSGHRSFYSDCLPAFHQRNHRQHHCLRLSPPASELISAVDIHYQNQLIFSRVRVTETKSGWFQSSPLSIDLLDPKEMVVTPVKFHLEEDSLIHIEESMNLNWMLIHPMHKRAVNVSSLNPVLVQRHWLTGEIQVRYSTFLSGEGGSGSSPELLQCKVEVTCGGKEGGEMHVRDVSMWVEDMDGKILSGRDSLVLLEEAMLGGRRKRKSGEEKKRYEEYEELVRERKVRKHRRERKIDMAFTIAGFTIFMIFWLSLYLLLFL